MATLIKTGPHVLSPTSAAMLWSGAAPIVKAVDNTQALAAAPPGAITVFRHYFPNQDILRNGASVAFEILETLGGFVPTYVEIYNEVAQTMAEGFPDHLRLIQEAVPVLNGAGIGVAGGGFSWGKPDDETWLYLADNGFGGMQKVLIHEYWGIAGFTEKSALHHRRLDALVAGNHPGFIIGECGRDVVDPGDQPGWKKTGITPAQYVSEIQAYDLEIAKDGYVEGATVFTAGANCDGDPPTCWDWFDVDELVPALLGIGPPPPPPPPPPTGTSPILAIAFAGLGAVAVGLLAAQLSGVQAEVTVRRPVGEPITVQLLGPSGKVVRERQVYEIEEGQAIPPGYRRVG